MTSLMEEVLRTGTAAGVRARYGLKYSGRGQDRHIARRLVRGLHLGIALRGVGGVRRQPRAQPGRRALGGAHLGGIHEAGAGVFASIAMPSRSRRRRELCRWISIRCRVCSPRPPAPVRGRKSSSPARSRWPSARCMVAGALTLQMLPDGIRGRTGPQRQQPAVPLPSPVRKETARCRRLTSRAGQRGRRGMRVPLRLPRRFRSRNQRRRKERDSPSYLRCV